ncbi:flagellar FliL protein [Paracoccus halophilus]|uniref:Flagellar protein FliL n=1 Tax=Paracoccus halophilus TaxID=376733 RepID=A0A099F832_9RHOB|nr:flagellar basal body-associated FliL family protein [Paracoccus halophilus]KGJ06277.1 flagellar basal body protein FliL [Paracoccus halophilus]SFA45204.1 flagellar FliL protein [Paracoccus halophilus]
MADVTDIVEEKETGAGLRRMLLLAGLLVGAAAGGFASTYLGFWSPADIIAAGEEKSAEEGGYAEEFVDLPQIVLTLSGSEMRMIVMTIKVETDSTHRAEVEHLTPRLLDSFNSFLSDVDPSAFERRGILDIIRNELATRAVYVLGKSAFTDLLITEFRIQ